MPIIRLEEPNLRGAAYSQGERAIYLWGGALWKVDLETGRTRRLALPESPTGFGEAGALAEFSGGAERHLILQDGHPEGALISLELSTRRRTVIDKKMSTKDVVMATLFNRRGVITVHRGGQVRFYEWRAAGSRTPASPDGYREIYSFYTPSWQAGLLQADVDSDGRPDLLCGAYWLKSPVSFALPWRLFAIHSSFERQDSSTGRLLWRELFEKGKPGVVFAQREASPARLLWLPRPANPTALWPAIPIGKELKLRRIRGLAAGDLTGDGLDDLVVGENAGSGSRILILRNLGPTSMSSRTLVTAPHGVLELWILNNNRTIAALMTNELRRWTRPF